ncbi:MAG: hypothetical protein JSR09_02590 [Bacteroidetes bacterium]|nr:hypothetical protein [Bacteroidota bacterium]MBS1638839.1 hypothetical protein [Bacteroidota bacterium]MBS1648571.1 hypothetical protein [Bacteroidota bacterium]
MQFQPNNILTKKHQEVYKLMQAGYTSQQIAHAIKMSELTVKIIIRKIKKALEKN